MGLPVVFELLLANGLHTLFIVEGIPQLGDYEQLLALDESVLDGSCKALTGFFLVTVI